MKKCLRLAAAALALVCMAGMLAGCGNDPGAATKPEADKIVDEINTYITNPEFEITDTFRHKDNVVEGEFIHNNYIIQFSDEFANTNLDLIYTKDTHEFAGIKVYTQAFSTGNEQAQDVFSAASIAFIKIDTLGLKGMLDFDTYLSLKKSEKVGTYRYTVPYKGSGGGFIVSEYYDQLKFEN